MLQARLATLAIGLTISAFRMTAAPQSSASQSNATGTGQNIPKWEAVSVKACSGEPAPAAPGNTSTDRIALNCQSLLSFVFSAYTIYEGGRYNGLVAGSIRYDGFPEWTRTERFTIEAKAEGSPGQAMMRGPMMQKILEDRFHLKVHRETKEGTVYILSVAKGGPKMQTLQPGGCELFDLAGALALPPSACYNEVKRGPARTWDAWTNMDSLARYLTVLFADPAVGDTPVLDRTGLAGGYHVQLKFAPPLDSSAPQPVDDPSVPSVFTALQSLGLKLESGRGPRQYLIFDHADRPSGN
jgi:uncharacterized protein (TIGR03435 family)